MSCLFPPFTQSHILTSIQAVGSFEFEFSNTAADTVTVTENKTPAAPPAGFELLETSSFKVALATSKGAGLTLSKIDYIFDTASPGVQGKDITKARVGKLCTDTNSFTISETLGELEFEAEENEVTLNLNKDVTAEGEWGEFFFFLGLSSNYDADGCAQVSFSQSPVVPALQLEMPPLLLLLLLLLKNRGTVCRDMHVARSSRIHNAIRLSKHTFVKVCIPRRTVPQLHRCTMF